MNEHIKARIISSAEELLARSGCDSIEDAFVQLIGSEEGLLA